MGFERRERVGDRAVIRRLWGFRGGRAVNFNHRFVASTFFGQIPSKTVAFGSEGRRGGGEGACSVRKVNSSDISSMCTVNARGMQSYADVVL